MNENPPSSASSPGIKDFDETRACGYIIIGFLVTLILGFGFMLLFLGIVRLLPIAILYWKPAHRIFVRHMTKNPEQEFISRPLTFGSLLSFILVFVISVMFLGLGIWALYDFGFLGQNLLYIFLHYGFQII